MSDFDAIRAAVSIEAVLEHHGCDTPRRGRMACMLHGGRNASAFSVRGRWFSCFNCGAHGDVIELERLLGGGETAEAAMRLCERHRIDPAAGVDRATARRRWRRLARLNSWWRGRMWQWGRALFITETAVRDWQTEAAAADDAWWDELQDRCLARDRAEAMFATFFELRTIEQRAGAFTVEQRGLVTFPWEAA